MMKKRFVAVVMMAVLMLLCCGFAACSITDEGTYFTVTFYDGETVLKTEKVAEGKTVTKWDDPTVDGCTFTGWYGVPSLMFDFDFTKEITKDTPIYGGFVEYAEDTRDFYMLGSGTSPVLADSNWGDGTNEKLVANHTATENIFTLTADLYIGDQFVFAINSEWETKRGYGYIENAGDYFTGATSAYDTSSRGANITVAVDGNYTMELHTFPKEDYTDDTMSGYTEESKACYVHNNFDYISFTYNGDIVEDKAEAYNEYYIKGDRITDWIDVYTSDVKMVRNAQTETYTYSRFLVENDEFMFTSRVVTEGVEGAGAGTSYIKGGALSGSEEYLQNLGGYNIKVLQTGYYTFTYVEATGVLTATVDTSYSLGVGDIYVCGLNNDWTTLNSANKFTVSETDPYIYELASITLAENDSFKIQEVTSGATEVSWGDTGTNVASYNYLKITSATAWDSTANDGAGATVTINENGNFSAADLTGEWPNYNIKCNVAGTYTIVYDAYSNMMTFKLVG